MNHTLSDVDNRLMLYKKCNHIPIAEIEKYTFDEIQNEFYKRKTDDYVGTKIKIKYLKHFPQASNCVILNCANSDSVNAEYRIDHGITQEGQLFHDTDVFVANLKNFYPFDFINELLYVKNVTFHNNQDIQWDPTCLRKNDIIFAASKRLKNPYQTEQLKPALERIIDSIFKVAYINQKSTLLLWPIGCGVFKNDQHKYDLYKYTCNKYMISINLQYRVITYPFKMRFSENTHKKFKSMIHPKLKANIHKFKKGGYYFLPTYHGCGKRNRNGTNKKVNYRIGDMCEKATYNLNWKTWDKNFLTKYI